MTRKLTEKQKAFADEIAKPKEIIETMISLFYKEEATEKEKEEIAYLVCKARFDCSDEMATKLNKDMSKYAYGYLKRKKKYNIKMHKRREGKREGLSFEQWQENLKYFNYECCYCGSGERIEMDHLFPFSKGGKLTKKNTVPACKSCNSSKNDKLFEEWYKNTSFYDKEKENKINNFLKSR